MSTELYEIGIYQVDSQMSLMADIAVDRRGNSYGAGMAGNVDRMSDVLFGSVQGRLLAATGNDGTNIRAVEGTMATDWHPPEVAAKFQSQIIAASIDRENF